MAPQDRGWGLVVHTRTRGAKKHRGNPKRHHRLKREGVAVEGQATTKRGRTHGEDKREGKHGGPTSGDIPPDTREGRDTLPTERGGGVEKLHPRTGQKQQQWTVVRVSAGMSAWLESKRDEAGLVTRHVLRLTD